MSRIGKKPVKVPTDIKIDIKDSVISFTKGNKQKSYDFGSNVKVNFENNEIVVEKIRDAQELVKFVGLHRSNINNIVSGLITPFINTLEFNGVGYRAVVAGKYLILGLGYSHDIAFETPENVSIRVEKPNLIIIESEDKELSGRVASQIKSFRKPEPYKGKGIKKVGEFIVRKEGKKK